MACRFAITKQGITIKIETEQNVECYFCYDGAKYGLAINEVTDEKHGMPLLLR
jgi:hypothetical protein